VPFNPIEYLKRPWRYRSMRTIKSVLVSDSLMVVPFALQLWFSPP
jgi:hypothetical protein